LLLSNDGQYIASVSDDGTIKVWNPLSSTELGTLIGHGGPVRGTSFGKGNQIISSSDDKTARIWEIEGEKQDDSFGYMTLENEQDNQHKQAYIVIHLKLMISDYQKLKISWYLVVMI